MSNSVKIRLFVAATVPESRLEALTRDVAGLKGDLQGGRWTDLANQHLTLKFLGSVDEALVPQVTAAVEQATGSKVAGVSLAGLGAFPNGRRARVLWAGIRDEEKVLQELAASLEQNLEALGFAREARAFTPHLTLARFRTPVTLRELPDLGSDTTEEFPIQEVVLFRSHLSPRGARYEALEHFALVPQV